MTPSQYIYALAAVALAIAIFKSHRGFLLASVGLVIAGLLLPVFVR